MNDLYARLNDDPEVQNCHPKFIARIGGANTLIANVVEGVVYLTDEGKEYLKKSEPTPMEDVADEVKPKRKTHKVSLDDISID